MLQGIAMRRDRQGNPVPVRVIIDECHNFATKSMQTIITEAAKFKLFIFMAQQEIGQGMTAELQSAVLNTSAQISGRATAKFYGQITSMLDVDQSVIRGLDVGEFVIHIAGMRPFKFATHKLLLKREHCMNDIAWAFVKQWQLKRYYRDTTLPRIVEPVTEEEIL
jgi:hypothetical protein